MLINTNDCTHSKQKYEEIAYISYISFILFFRSLETTCRTQSEQTKIDYATAKKKILCIINN